MENPPLLSNPKAGSIKPHHGDPAVPYGIDMVVGMVMGFAHIQRQEGIYVGSGVFIVVVV